MGNGTCNQQIVDKILSFSDDLGVVRADMPSFENCEDQGTFGNASGAAIKHWLSKDEYDPNTCKVTSRQTEYTVYAKNDYKRCVCDSWDPSNANCMQNGI